MPLTVVKTAAINYDSPYKLEIKEKIGSFFEDKKPIDIKVSMPRNEYMAGECIEVMLFGDFSHLKSENCTYGLILIR